MTRFAFVLLTTCMCAVGACRVGSDKCQYGCESSGAPYTCLCFRGFALDSSQTTCIDINECIETDHGCNQICDNELGSYFCSCYPGYILGNDRKTCKDINECRSSTHGCERDCYNTDGSYVCGCRRGYTLDRDGKTCDDIDECANRNHGCTHKCTNTIGSYECSCNPGYILGKDGKTCQDIDECKDNTHTCAHSQYCVNINGSYHCPCKTGYRPMAGGHCADINECPYPWVHGCTHNCVNTDGGYYCTCDQYYKLGGDGKTCEVPGRIPERFIKKNQDCVSGWENTYGWEVRWRHDYDTCNCNDFRYHFCGIEVIQMWKSKYKCGRFIANGGTYRAMERRTTFWSTHCMVWKYQCKDGDVTRVPDSGEIDKMYCP